MLSKEKGGVDILHGRQTSDRILQSISTIYTPQLATNPSQQFLQALPGRLSGLNVNFSSGAPSTDIGSGYNVRGRGQTILIDGVQRSFTSLDPEQIESISVLKDALSTVMFGQRSTNGIILITTKKGDRGAPRISFTAQTGIIEPLKLPKTLPAWQYATLYNEAQLNDADPASVQPVVVKYSAADIEAYKNKTDPYGHPDVDWYNTILKKNSTVSRYNFNVQGSGSSVRYFVDLDYSREDGLFKSADFNAYNTNAQLQRYLVRSNVGVDITRTTFMQVNLLGRIQRNNQPGNKDGENTGAQDIFNTLLVTPRNAYPIFNADGSLGGNDNYQSVNLWGKTVYSGYKIGDTRDVAVDLQLTQKLDVLAKGLWIKVQGSFNNTGNYLTNRYKEFATFLKNPNGTYKQYGTNTEQSNSGAAKDRTQVTYLEASIGYDKQFGPHAINATLVADRQSSRLNGNIPEQYTDFAGRLTYNFNEKYFAELAGSYAGYNYFAPGERFGFFGAGGIGWNVHKEDFIKNNIPQISQLKLRATYGKTGQANTGYYVYIQRYYVPENNTDNNVAYWWGPSASLERGALENGLANKDITWEKANKLNLGLDLGLWNNKLTLSADYYDNRLYDLVSVRGKNSVILGVTYPPENIQRINYNGVDLSLTYQDRVKNFNYFISGNFSTVQSKAVFLDEFKRDFGYQYLTGLQSGIRTGYIATGLFQSQAEINDPSVAVFGPRTSLRPGDIRYKDRNADGLIDTRDEGVIGDGKATLFFGLTAGFNYKGFDVSILFQGTVNRVAYMSGDIEWPFGGNGNNNAYEHSLQRWTAANAATARLPRAWIGSNQNNQLISTFWIKPADFIRLKNAQIGYTMPSRLTKKLGIPSIRLFTNGLNLLTFSEIYDFRDDIDPEAMGSAYPIPRIINFGINIKL